MLGLTIREVTKHIKEGKVSAKQLYNRCRKRGELFNKELNFFITTTFEAAEQQAEEIDERISKGEPPGYLGGIPVAFKDNFSIKGVDTTCASRSLIGYKPPFTATVVQRMLNEGAVSMGKLNLDEFAMGSFSTDSIYGPVRNPWRYPFDLSADERSKNESNEGHAASLSDSGWFFAGGSSGGSAVAVATGACFAALGSDTGGSVRLPASYCGLVGYKPTYGLLSRHGLVPLVHSFDVPGIITRYVDDIATVLGAVGGHDPLDSTTVQDPFHPFTIPDDFSVEGLHIGIPKEFHDPNTTIDVLEAWSRSIDLFEKEGAHVSQVSLPHHKYTMPCYSILCPVEVASNMSIYDGIEFGHRSDNGTSTDELYAASRQEGLSAHVRARILSGNYFLLESNYEKYFEKAMKVRRLITNDLDIVFESGIDVLLVPTTISDAKTQMNSIRFGDGYNKYEKGLITDSFTLSSNLAGLPSISVPASLSTNGLPIGVQLIGSRFSDRKLLSAAKWFERQLQFPHHILDEQLNAFENKTNFN